MIRAFVIAMLNEADAVRPYLKPDDRLYVSGIGKVNAAAATQKAICEGATEIWNFGFAGGFDPSMNVGDIVAISSAVEYDFDLAKLNNTRVGQLNERNSPYIPLSKIERATLPPTPTPPPTPPPPSTPNASPYPYAILASGDRFNDSDDDLALLKELGATVRDMEGGAIAHVCEKEGVPCREVKCISDVHGRGAMTEQYLDNIPLCQQKLGEAVKELI